MANSRNSDIWLASSKEVENQVASFLQNGLVLRFKQLDQVLKSADFHIENQLALIKQQVGDYGVWGEVTSKNEAEIGVATEAATEKVTTPKRNDVQVEKDPPEGGPSAATPSGSCGVAAVKTGNDNGVKVTDKATKRKLTDEPSDGTGNGGPPISPPKKPFQENGSLVIKPAEKGQRFKRRVKDDGHPSGGGGTIGTLTQMNSSAVIAKQASVALPLIRSVLGDLNLLEMQLNLMMTGPTEVIALMDKTYFKGRLSAALESVNDTKDTAENIDLEMYSYHKKRTQLISELGSNPIASPDILLSIIHLDTYLFRRLHQILTEFRNTYYLALTMDHILSENVKKLEGAPGTTAAAAGDAEK